MYYIHTNVKMFKCNICKEEFNGKSSLNSHSYTHTDKKFQCNVFKKEFKVKSVLTSPVCTGDVLKQFQCELCQKSFEGKDEFNFHCLPGSVQ